jgi:signal peptidase I
VRADLSLTPHERANVLEPPVTPRATSVDDPTDELPRVPPPPALPAGALAGTGDPVRRRRRRNPLWTTIEWVVLIGAALLIALLIKTFLFQAFWIPSESMVPTLREDDRVLVNKLSYRLHDVHRGDIVVFKAPEGAESQIEDLVKRVVGLGGETIEGRDGVIFIDGRPLEEPYLPQGTVSRTFAPTEVPAGSVFVLGDNRLASKDSTAFGPIPETDIVGRVFIRIWPPGRIGFF